MSLTLTLRSEPPARVLAAALAPERLCGLNGSAVAAVGLRCGGETVAAGDLFDVSGAGTEVEELVLVGDLRRFDGIGAGMTSGEIDVRGDVGAWAGAELHGGRLVVRGNAGDRLGAAYPGMRVGMTHGEILVFGNAGEEAGAGLRRGLIAIGGRAGAGAGLRMLAGTVIALGGVETGAGQGNRRGSIVSGRGAQPLPSYSFAARYAPPALRLQLLRLRELGMAVPDAMLSGNWARWS